MQKKTLLCLALGAVVWCGVPQVMAREGDAPKDGGHYDKDKPHKEGEQGDKRTEAEKMLQAFTEHLKLTPEQQDKIKPILTDMTEQITAAKHDKTQSEQQRNKKVMAIRKAAFDKIAEILTPEQKAIFNKHRAGVDGGGKDKPHNNDQHNNDQHNNGQHNNGQH